MAHTKEELEAMGLTPPEVAAALGATGGRQISQASPAALANIARIKVEEERAKLWALYKIALPLAQADLSSEGFCDEAMTLAHRFLARWKAETEVPEGLDEPEPGVLTNDQRRQKLTADESNRIGAELAGLRGKL